MTNSWIKAFVAAAGVAENNIMDEIVFAPITDTKGFDYKQTTKLPLIKMRQSGGKMSRESELRQEARDLIRQHLGCEVPDAELETLDQAEELIAALAEWEDIKEKYCRRPAPDAE